MKRTIIILSIFVALSSLASTQIDLLNLDNYANQAIPAYITKDNTPPNNALTDEGATLGRVLFYDKLLSRNQTISCASCHQQQFAFSDTARTSTGLSGGQTGRHSMRLVNSRFSNEGRFFWDERASSLENQSTQPIQDHVEMGFSGADGDPDLDSLIRRMEQTPYYGPLFELTFGNPNITEIRMQRALAQFIRSIQSFDSRYDAGRALVNNNNAPFPNFSPEENQGKALFMNAPNQQGAGCNGCHRAPEFDIDPASLNNGIVSVANDSTAIDLTNTRAPSLRDLFNPGGTLNGPLMHNGIFTSLEQAINHYDSIVVSPDNMFLDPRLQGPPGPGGGQGQRLNLDQAQKDALIAFMRTLSGTNLYTDPKWSDPFDENGDLELEGLNTSIEAEPIQFGRFFPNPTQRYVRVEVPGGNYQLRIFTLAGQHVLSKRINGAEELDLSMYRPGIYFAELWDLTNGQRIVQKIVRN